MDTKAESGKGGGVMNWEIGIDIYTLMCIKWVTIKNLLYKKINKIKFKNSKKKEHMILHAKHHSKILQCITTYKFDTSISILQRH